MNGNNAFNNASSSSWYVGQVTGHWSMVKVTPAVFHSDLPAGIQLRKSPADICPSPGPEFHCSERPVCLPRIPEVQEKIPKYSEIDNWAVAPSILEMRNIAGKCIKMLKNAGKCVPQNIPLPCGIPFNPMTL
jgi:hypothetical protein